MDTACGLKDDPTIYPLLYRTHAHEHGKEVAGWKIDGDGNWSLMARDGPSQMSQSYSFESSFSLQENDNSKGDTQVCIRCREGDEMCNL